MTTFEFALIGAGVVAIAFFVMAKLDEAWHRKHRHS